MCPVICGTIVNKGIGQKDFDRKLKMLRAPLFSLLQLCQSKEFVKSEENVKNIKEGMAELLKSESYQLFKQLEIHKKLEGWEKLLRKKCTQNELMDIKNVNLPDLSQNMIEKDFFVYAGILKPGYH